VSSFAVNMDLEKSMIIGAGVDIIEIARLRNALERLKDRFIQRVFTPEEQQFCNQHRDPAPHYAARFAAKEAMFKALGTGWAKGVTWQDVEVLRQQKEAPTLRLHGEAQRLSQLMGATRIHLSLSHSEHSAIAMVILEQ
jgi:holo-[acyl-carrier protein] synthase